jgi:hypothetical protein
VRRQAATRRGVHTTGWTWRGDGSRSLRAGLSQITSSRRVSFNAARSVARFLSRVAALVGLPYRCGACAPAENHRHARQSGPASLLKRLQVLLASRRTSPTDGCSVVARTRSICREAGASSRNPDPPQWCRDREQIAHNGDGQEDMVARWLLACTRYGTASTVASRHDDRDDLGHSNTKQHSSTLSRTNRADS